MKNPASAISVGLHGLRTPGFTGYWKRAAVSFCPIIPILATVLPSSAALAVTASGAISVPASHWKYTGIRVRAGDLLRITASGSWTDGSTTSGPSGAAKRWPDNFFNLADLGACSFCAKTDTSQWGALIGYIGTSPPVAGSYASASARPQALKVFYVGGGYEAAALRSGKLWLGKNADAYSGYTSDNHGHVVAKIAVGPPQTSAQMAARARVAALSVNALSPLREAVNFCSRAVLDAFSSAAIGAALKKLLPHADDVYEGATIVGDVISIDYETTSGQIANATFDLGRLVFEIIGQVPGFKLFGIVGDPAIGCTEAAFWYTGQLGSELGRLLRKKLQPPTTVTASIGGDWLVQRKLVSCINFPGGCQPTPMPVRFTHCTRTKCLMSRTDGVWKHSHTIVRQGRTWVAHFTDIGVSCGSRSNPANITIKLSVTTGHRRHGINSATSWGGTYYVAATRNPPNCHGNGRALELLVADRSPAAVIGGDWEGRYTCAQGLTGLDLKVSRQGASLRATFSFYPLTSNPTVPVGIYTMTGTYRSASKIVLHGQKWILHPPGYALVGLTGKIAGKVFHGTVQGTACTTFSLTKPTGHPSRASLIGTWKGLYFGCAQGTTGLRLVIKRNGASGHKLNATFNFHAVASNPGVPSGSYAMKGYWFPGGVALTGTHWINQPPGYGFVSLVGRSPAKGAKTFKGAVPECTTFSLKRA